MADFRTHLGVAAAGGAVLAHGGWQVGLWELWQGGVVFGLVTFGGILPDIDADSSKAIRLIFNLLAVASVVLAIAAGGALAAIETTVLMTVEETIEALAKGKGIGYRRPGASPAT